jgi:hypothetical protein
MPDFVDALSSYKDRFSNYLRSKWNGFSSWAGLGRKKYRLRNKYGVYKDYVKENLSTYGKAYVKYALFEITPFVVAYGLMLNFPVSVLLGWALTVETVVSWGLVFYFVSEEFTEIANELKPYVRISAKVDN